MENIYGSPLPFIVTKNNSKESKIILKFMGAGEKVQFLREVVALMTRVFFFSSIHMETHNHP